ncbi:type IX secretion system protein PorD [Psychroserpens sp. MEBiC05023]
MRKYIYSLLIILITAKSWSQELNCNVVVNAQQTGNENVQVFKTLERQLREFVNNTQWTNKSYKNQERIDCGMVITINDYDTDRFKATLQIQSSRPVYGSTYGTPIYNFNDKDFNFQYLEFQNFVYNPTQFESNLISVISFHIYMMLGLDADSFAPNGGDEYFKQAQTILNYSQQNNAKGWKLEDGQQTRFVLIDNILSPTFIDFRNVMYDYHRNGLDLMSEDAKKGKQGIADAIDGLKKMNSRRPNSFLMRVFFDAKSDEIKDVFSGGPNVNVAELTSTLTKIAPMHSSKWRAIKF